MDYAIVEISGRQFWIEPQKYYDINYMRLKHGTKLYLKKILLINKERNIQIGFPFIENVSVEGTILTHFSDKKIIVYKMKPKKKYRRKTGHRQILTRLFINKI